MSEFPKNTNDNKLIEKVKEVLKKKGEQKTPKLAEKVDNIADGISESTAKSKLYTNRQYFEENENIETEEKADGTSGNPTRYWRLSE